MSDKIALNGFRAARFWPITANDATAYATGTMQSFIGARNLTKDENGTEYTIPGDDDIYDSGTEFNYFDMEFEVNELPLSIAAALRGATYTEATKTYLFNKDDKAIEFAFGYAAPMLSGEFRMWKHYCCKLMSVKVDLQTKTPDNREVSTYKLQIRALGRKANGDVELVQDSSDKTYDWLNTIDQLPVEGGGGE
jgi:phi13 family phage major tail protein